MAGLIERGRCLVLIPAYNAEAEIAEVVKKVRHQNFPVLVVDDGSSDNTAVKVMDLGVPVLVSEKNAGKGAALRNGFEWFLNKDYQAVILMDADGQHDALELDDFLKALNENSADLVIGNRMTEPKGMPWIRRLTNRFLSALLSWFSGWKIPDSQCGYRAIRREALKKMRFTSDHFEIESEMILEAAERGLHIRSVPIRSVYESHSSRIRPLKDTFRFFFFLIRRFFLKKARRNA